MRPVFSLRPLITTAALLASAAALPGAVHAQTPPAPAPAPAMAPMPAPAPAPAPAPLSDLAMDIPTPAGATVQAEMDIHDDDLLGVYKSFLSGIGQGIQMAPVYPNAPARPQTSSDQMAAILSNADLSDMLKGTTHVHMIVFKTADAPAPVVHIPKTASKKPVVIMSPPSITSDETGFYETAFGAEGGHRILFANIDPLHMTMVSFGHARGYAVMVQVPGTIAVMRADGYPDLSKLSALMTQVSAVAAKAALDTVNARKKTADDH